MNKIISLVIAALGLLLIVAPDYLLSKDSTNSVLSSVYNYHQIVGFVLLGAAYYVHDIMNTELFQQENTTISELLVPSLPDYEGTASSTTSSE